MVKLRKKNYDQKHLKSIHSKQTKTDPLVIEKIEVTNEYKKKNKQRILEISLGLILFVCIARTC